MWSRGRLDIGLLDFAAALAYTAISPPKENVHNRIAEFWPDDLIQTCLSVRSGFDSLLATFDFDKDDEILISAVTVPAMKDIICDHDLVPVPLDLNVNTAFPALDACRSKVTSRTRAIVLAPLFGTRTDLTEYRKLADEFNLILVEDAAQAFDGIYCGDQSAHVSMFSFGSIKRRTALGGGCYGVSKQQHG